jgi:signal transduction histidine kinase/DNA-binding response OmpR family regulator
MIEATLAHNGIPGMWLDAEWRVKAANDEARRIFADADMRDIRTLALANAGQEEMARLNYLLSERNPFFTFDFQYKPADGGARWYRLLMGPVRDSGALAIFDDVTPFRQKEQVLVAAKENAEKASISRSQFLANISHEIRTPIQTIIGMMELLDETKLDEEQTEYVRQVKFSTDVMLTLINDVLDFSKVEAGQLKIEHIEYDLSNVIERTVDLVSMEAHKKGLEICIDISPALPVMVITDPGRLQQVILNLVKNAVKFTAKGYILVSAKPVHDAILFEVNDTGIGITDDVQKKLFTQFFQADASTTRKYGGTGLGLAISRNIVELMNGTIGVHGNASGGSCFWFTVPLVKAPAQPPAETRALRATTRFLVVDDNELTLSLIYNMLVSLGYTDITGATSGKAALNALHTARRVTQPFDIVLIDMIMPEMDGWRLAAEINKNHDINQAQLYLMVPEGSFGADAKMKLLEWFNGYLYKPIKRRKLAELLREHHQPTIDLEVVEELEAVDDAEADGEGEAERAPELPAKGLTALVVEDHPVNRKLMKVFLERAGASVVTAEDGQEAVEVMAGKDAAFDIVFMDIQMPRLNGYEAAAWMREHGYKKSIIACTASAQENEREQCLLYGMTDILPKPYRKENIIAMLLKHTGRSGPSASADAADAANPANALAEADSAPVFVSQEFFDIMMGDVDAAKLLMREFLSQTKQHLALLGEDIANGDRESVSKTAHLIKGSASNVTAARLAKASLAVERGAANMPDDVLKSAFERMERELERLERQLAQEGYS